jgi:hypothetical protein
MFSKPAAIYVSKIARISLVLSQARENVEKIGHLMSDSKTALSSLKETYWTLKIGQRHTIVH